MTLIDILLPFYGDVDYMHLAVQSVLEQTDDDWRLTVVDDNYPDPSVATWFASLADPRVHYTRNSTNLGANANYRRALGMATAPWVVVMGADDLMLPHYVATLRRLTSKWPSATVFQPGVEVVDGSGAVTAPLADRVKAALAPRTVGTRQLAGEELSASLLRANWTYFPSLCWRRDVVASIGFRPGLDVVQDLALLLDVVVTGGVLVVDHEPAFHYRRHSGSDSALRAATGRRFDEERAFFRAAARDARARGWERAARAARWHLTSRLNAASLLSRALSRRDWTSVAVLLRHALAA